MSYQEKLAREIDEVLDSLEKEKRVLVAAWITTEICSKHVEKGLAPELCEDREFWHYGGYATTRDEVRRRINVRRGDKVEGHGRQHWLPGYEHLQPYYMVVRCGDEVGVATPDLEDSELRLKSAQYRSMGDGCYAHADEIERYVNTRQPQEKKREA